nr:MAG TPA: hypothetical protein [Caudoviricetes sp.]
MRVKAVDSLTNESYNNKCKPTKAHKVVYKCKYTLNIA